MKKEWTKTWYQILSTEELQTKLTEARDSLKYSARMGQDAVSLMWQFRIQDLEKELLVRSKELAVN